MKLVQQTEAFEASLGKKCLVDLVQQADALADLLRKKAGLPPRSASSATPAEPPPLRKVKTAEGLYKCSRCPKTSQNWHTLKCHFQSHLTQAERGNEYVCHICNKKLTRRSTLNEHMKGHQPKSFACRFQGCETAFQTEKGRDRHEGEVHQELKANYKCQFCGREFQQVKQNSIKKHERNCSHNSNYRGPYQCKRGCGKEFVLSSGEKRHRGICIGPQ